MGPAGEVSTKAKQGLFQAGPGRTWTTRRKQAGPCASSRDRGTRRALERRASRGSTGAWPWRVYGRAENPAFGQWSIDAWSDYPHLQVGTSIATGEGPIAKRVAELKMTRRVTTVVPHFLMAAAVLAETDFLLSVPSVSMNSVSSRFELECQALPFDMTRLSLSLYRSATNGAEPGVRWFLERIVAACSRLR